jgi:hypothetical protein
MLISSTEAEFYRSASIDPSHVGEVLGSGAQNLVRELNIPDSPKVIKAPLDAVRGDVQDYISSLIVGQTWESAERELGICQLYFGNFMPYTEIRPTLDGSRFVLIQDRLDFEHITPEMVAESDSVRMQLQDIMCANGELMDNEKLWLDAMGLNWFKLSLLLGPDGIPYMENIVREKATGDVRIIDTGLFGMGAIHMPQYLLQYENMRRFGLPFDGRKQ